MSPIKTQLYRIVVLYRVPDPKGGGGVLSKGGGGVLT